MPAKPAPSRPPSKRAGARAKALGDLTDAEVLVVGPGALGSLFAARLADAGRRVALATRSPETAALLRESGVRATAHDGSVVAAQVAALAEPTALPGLRLLVLATKCDDAEAALSQWLPHIPEDCPVVALQNGVIGDRLKAISGWRHVECTVSIPVTLVAPGTAVETGPGFIHVGPWPEATPRDDPKWFKAVAEQLAPVATVHGSANMRGVKWSKLLVNSCITSLGAVTGEGLGRILQDPDARKAFLAIVEEGVAAGKADGVRFERLGSFRPRLMAAPVPGRQLLLKAMARKVLRHKSSSLQSLERNQRTEVDHLNGRIVATGKAHGVPTPVNEAVLRTVHEVEAGRLRPSLDLLWRVRGQD